LAQAIWVQDGYSQPDHRNNFQVVLRSLLHMADHSPLLMSPPAQEDMTGVESLGKYIVDMELTKGPSGAERLVVFIPGWPDTRELFDPYVDAVQAKFAVLSITVPGFERPPHQPHSKWPHDGYPLRTFYAMLHKFIQEKKMELQQQGVGINEVNLVGHDFGALHSHALDWLYPRCYGRIVAFDVGPVVGSFTSGPNILISCYQTQFSRYHMKNPCVHCPCYYPVWVKNFLATGTAPKVHLDRPTESWMGSPEFWIYSRMYSHCFASTFGLCSCCCCTPCALGCFKPCNLKFSTEIYNLNSDKSYLEQRVANNHNMFFYCSPVFANGDFVSQLGTDAIKMEGGHWFLVPESKGGVAKRETVLQIQETMVEFLSRK